MLQSVLWRILLPNAWLLGDDGMMVRKHEGYPFRKCVSFEYWRSLTGKCTLHRRTSVFDIDFHRIEQLHHSICKSLACINGSRTHWLACLNLIWKKVVTLTNDTGRRYALYSSLSCIKTNGNPWTRLYHKLNDFNICICNSHTRSPFISRTIIIDVFNVLKLFIHSLYWTSFRFLSDSKFFWWYSKTRNSDDLRNTLFCTETWVSETFSKQQDDEAQNGDLAECVYKELS